MNESIQGGGTSSVRPVAESLHVQEDAQASEVRTKRIIVVVLIVLIIGGALAFVRHSNTPEDVASQEAAPMGQQQPAAVQAAPPQAVPASTPKGKDFGF